MTQSFNDAGFMHKNLHSLFSSNHYRYDDVTDPPGEVYGQLKQYLQLYLEPASLRTVWKCFCSAESIIDKACTELNVMSALKSTGVAPRDNKPVWEKILNLECSLIKQKSTRYSTASIILLTYMIKRYGYGRRI